MLNFKKSKKTVSDLPDSGLTKNLRAAIRYIREDINAFISGLGLFKASKAVAVKLMDISSKGVLISTSRKLRINKKITLLLQFKSGKTFIINAAVVRRSSTSNYEYGIKFQGYHHDLGDYLLESQSKLIFK